MSNSLQGPSKSKPISSGIVRVLSSCSSDASGEHPDVSHRWFGPARFIGHEVRDPSALHDANTEVNPDPRARAVWLRYGHIYQS